MLLTSRRSLSIPLLFVTASVACNDEAPSTAEADKGGVEEMSIVVEADKSRILEEEQSLEKKKASMEEEQARLERERAEVAEKLSTLSKKDKSSRVQLEADQKRLQEEENRLRTRLRSFEQEREKLEQEKTKLLEKISKLEQPKGGGASDEVTVAQRERNIARREAEIAAREKAVAEREAEVGKALRDAQQLLSSLGAAPRTVIVNQTAAPSGGNATAASVQSLRRDVMRKMDNRGLLMDDLPPTARDLDNEAKNAAKNKDWQAASDALQKLGSVVDSTVINSAFVQGKMTRINRTYSGAKLEPATKAQIQKLLSEFSELATDGRWDGANRKANQMLTVYQSK